MLSYVKLSCQERYSGFSGIHETQMVIRLSSSVISNQTKIRLTEHRLLLPHAKVVHYMFLSAEGHAKHDAGADTDIGCAPPADRAGRAARPAKAHRLHPAGLRDRRHRPDPAGRRPGR